MNITSVLLGVVVSTLLGALLHFWRGGGLGKLIYYIILSWLGFWIGHMIGQMLGIQIFVIGTVYFGTGVVTALLFLAGGYWLGLVRPDTRAQ